jgi:hypothetical protein
MTLFSSHISSSQRALSAAKGKGGEGKEGGREGEGVVRSGKEAQGKDCLILFLSSSLALSFQSPFSLTLGPVESNEADAAILSAALNNQMLELASGRRGS